VDGRAELELVTDEPAAEQAGAKIRNLHRSLESRPTGGRLHRAGRMGAGMSVKPADGRRCGVRTYGGLRGLRGGTHAARADRYASYHSGADLGEFVQTIATPFSGYRDTPQAAATFCTISRRCSTSARHSYC